MADQDNVANAQQQMTLLLETGLDRRSSTLIVQIGEMYVENLVESQIDGNSGYYLEPIVEEMTAELFDLHAEHVPTIHSNGADLQTAVETAVWYQTECDAPHYHDVFAGNEVHDLTYGTEETEVAVQNFTEFDHVYLTNAVAPHNPIMLNVRYYWSLTCVDVFPQFTYSWEDDEGVYNEYVSPIYVNERFHCPSLTINGHYLFN